MTALIKVEFSFDLSGGLRRVLILFLQFAVFVLELISFTDEVFYIDLEVLRTTFELSIDFEHVDLVKLLRPQLDMPMVKLIEVFLQPVKLGLQLRLAFDVRLHFLVFELELFFVYTLLCV